MNFNLTQTSKLKTIVISVMLTALFFISLAFTQNETKYQYLSMTMDGNLIYLNLDYKNFEVINIKEEKNDKSRHDFGPLLRRIENYENEGWELVSNNVYMDSHFPFHNILMRRKK